MTPYDAILARLSSIEARCAAATPGPWWDGREFWMHKYARPPKHPGPRARWVTRAGRRIRDTWFLGIFGQKHVQIPKETAFDPITHDFDEYDFARVLALPWKQIKGSTVFPDAPRQEDEAFIVSSRVDVPALCAALREALAWIEAPVLESNAPLRDIAKALGVEVTP